MNYQDFHKYQPLQTYADDFRLICIPSDDTHNAVFDLLALQFLQYLYGNSTV